MFQLRLVAAFSLLITSLNAQPPTAGKIPPDHPERAKKGLELFRTTVRSVLTTKCLACHGGESVKSDFDLATRD
ncbi:MAG: hypothetical protein ACK5AN_04500, partial [Planctomyces sp.]